MDRGSLRRKLHIWESLDTSWVNSVTQMDEMTTLRTQLEYIYFLKIYIIFGYICIYIFWIYMYIYPSTASQDSPARRGLHPRQSST